MQLCFHGRESREQLDGVLVGKCQEAVPKKSWSLRSEDKLLPWVYQGLQNLMYRLFPVNGGRQKAKANGGSQAREKQALSSHSHLPTLLGAAFDPHVLDLGV